MTLDLNLHGYQEDNKQHVAVSSLISFVSFSLHATPVFSVLFVYFVGLKTSRLQIELRSTTLYIHVHRSSLA